MNQKRPALGKGLSALFPASVTTAASQPLFECPVDRIDALEAQPRTRFDDDALKDLAASIREAGIIQPLVVSEKENGRYGLIAGERRLRAAKIAGLSSVPVVVRQAAAEGAFIMALVENIQREDLNPVETARAYSRLTREFGMTQEEVSRRVGRRRSTVANSLRLLKLDGTVLQAVEDGRLAEGTARTLIGLDTEDQKSLLEKILSRNLSTREAEDLVKRMATAKPARKASDRSPAMSAYFQAATREIEESVGLPVTVSYRGNSGKLSISFNSLAQFRALRDMMSSVSGKSDKNQPQDQQNN